MSQVFLTSDTHFFHKKILEFERAARPFSSVEEMNEVLIDNWNSVVTKRDTVWHLGDVCFGKIENLEILSRLNGTKNLILGNHDQHGIHNYLRYFRKIEAAKKYDGYLWTHIPVHPGQFYRFIGNVHGHLHSGKIEDPRYVCVSVERYNLAPIAWEEIKHAK